MMRILSFVAIIAGFSLAAGQPATLTLRAKLRDFKDFRPNDTTTHPDFENDAYMECGGAGLGYAKNAIRMDGTVDTTQFRDDNRNPELQLLKHPSKTMACFSGFDYFEDWYNDDPRVNRSFYTDIVLTRNGQGLYVFDDDNFLPLNPGAGFRKFKSTDPDPFGPRPEITPTDVWGFTLELHTQFTYVAGANQVFSFKGDDDVWVFINGRLAIDLGGLHSSLTSTIDLDSRAEALGLVDGAAYPLDFFFAERHSTGSHCRITTSLQLVQKTALPTPVATPPGQVFRDPLRVTLHVPGVPDAQIRYTTNGSEPTETSPLYIDAIAISRTTVLKAKAFHDAYTPSPVLTETYAFDPPRLPQPVATPSGQNFQTSLSVSLVVPDHPLAEIRYTVNGADPDSASPLYTGPLDLRATTVIKAKAFQRDWVSSAITTETYTLVIPPPPPPPPNVITLELKRPVSQSELSPLAATLPQPSRPIAIVSSGPGAPTCLVCPPGTEILAVQELNFPEWTTTSREPFRYVFQIFDNLGQFVVSQSGQITQSQLDQTPADAMGYHALRFRWIPVSEKGVLVGTGAYILRGQVTSQPPTATTPGTQPSTKSMVKTFGFIRQR